MSPILVKGKILEHLDNIDNADILASILDFIENHNSDTVLSKEQLGDVEHRRNKYLQG